MIQPKPAFQQPIIVGGGNYPVTGPLGPMVEPRDGKQFTPYPFVPRSRGHNRGQRFISTYRLGRDGGRSKYAPHQGEREAARRAGLGFEGWCAN